MVKVVQEQQETSDDSRYLKEQDQRINDTTIKGNNNNNNDSHYEETISENKETVVVISIPDDSVADTLTQCSDIEYENDEDDEEDEEDEEEGSGNETLSTSESENEDWVADVSLPGLVPRHQEVTVPNEQFVLPNPEQAVFGEVCIKNSSNVHLGNKTFYKGPVTIKQFVYTNPSTTQVIEPTKCQNGRISDANGSDYASSKGEQNPRDPILPDNYEKVPHWLLSWKFAAMLCILALFFVTIVISAVLLTRTTDKSPFPQIPDSPTEEGVITENVRFVSRLEWGAQPPSEVPTPLITPVPYVFISHTATEFCKTQAECVGHVRFAQTFHIESRKWSDIAYNFLVGGDGLAYVGRGWDAVGAHTFGFNVKSIGISFIGTFNSVTPSNAQLHAAQQVIEQGIKLGKIAKDYKLLGHRQVSKTLSPGEALYQVIKTWPHWSPDP